VRRVTSLLEEVVYIYRATPKYGSTGESLIEVFTIDSTDTITLISVLDTATVAVAMNDQTGTFLFEMIEMKVQ
jgi:hypothetical protein